MHTVAAEYPYGTLSSTLTRSSHSGAALYETYVAGQEESGCVKLSKYLQEKVSENHPPLLPPGPNILYDYDYDHDHFEINLKFYYIL